MTDREKEVLNRQIGVLEGLSWIGCINANDNPVSEALEFVIKELQKLMDGGVEG